MCQAIHPGNASTMLFVRYSAFRKRPSSKKKRNAKNSEPRKKRKRLAPLNPCPVFRIHNTPLVTTLSCQVYYCLREIALKATDHSGAAPLILALHLAQVFGIELFREGG